MKCVNTRHKGFKYLAERNNLSVETLEQITHKYWIENKTDEYFPTDIYIQAQLGKIPYQESGENVIKLWERDYKEPKTFKSFEELEEARTEALKFFPEMAVTYHKGYNGDYVLTIRKPLKNLKISAKDLLNKETLSSQERSDFKLVTKDSVNEGINVEQFAIDINNKKPQMFTFKDGVSVRAPFKPNYQQEDALNAMDDFVKSSKHVFTLSGYAGTGKTSIIEILAQKMKKEHIPVLFCASTNKAAAVLNERVSKSGFTAQTLNKIFGISVEVDPTKSYNANNLVNKLRDVELPYGATVIIDEASMIDEENYGILNELATKNELKLIYVGDAAQLAPPKDNKLSKVFRDQSHDIKTLTIVERTGDNAILKEATDIRNGKPLSGKSSFNDRGQGVAYIKADNTKRKDDLIKAFVPRLQEDPDYFRILAYSNRQVSAYNTQVRKLLGYDDNIPRVNEPIVGYNNWKYDRNTNSYRFVNSESYKVTEVQQPKVITKVLKEAGKVILQVIPVTLEDSLGVKRSFNLIDVKENLVNREIALKLAKTKSELWNLINHLPKHSRERASYIKAANEIEEFLFVNDDLGEVKGKPYQKKVFDFGYAMTVHKSQGSTFKNVLIDDVDIVNTIKNSENTKSKQYTPYTDASTPSEIDFSNSEITSTTDVDLGDWASAVEDNTLMTPYPKKDSSMTDKQALLRQQLEYVAVSRASDTATVISNEVVKEDSPLNHLKDAIKAEATENVRSMTSDEVWKAAAEIEAPSTERTVEYRDQTYTIRGNHIYNKDGKEVYSKDAPNVGKDRNIILAKLAEVDERAVKVNHNGRTYYVDNKKNIISETSGIIVKWGEESGDRKAVLALAEQEFRDMIEPDLISGQIDELMEKAGIPYFNEEDMERYFQEHRKSLIQQAAEENKEMQEIKTKAIADGTFMKAPNGQPTKLNERQWLQVRTKNFINWFGDWINDPANASKIVDENGEPKVVYHFTDGTFNVFDKSKSLDGAFYFTDDATGETIFYPNDNTKKNKIAVFLNIQSPIYANRDNKAGKNEFIERSKNYFNKVKELSIKGDKRTEEENKEYYQLRKEGPYFGLIDIPTVLTEKEYKFLRENEADGIIRHWAEKLDDYEDTHDEYFYIAFNPNQIKSATDNNGDFSPFNNDIQMFIGKKARTQFEQSLKKARPDMSDAEIKSTLDFLHSLEDNKENTAYIKTAVRWIANRSITLPQDNTKARQAFDLARKKNLDLQKYKTLGELITSPEMQPKEKEKASFNPDKAKTFSNKRTVTTEGGRVFTVYDVENTEEGQKEVCKALAAHYATSPWCLSTFTATGEPTQSAKKYWNHYNSLPRKIAFENGKPVAFSSDNVDRKGQSHRMTDAELEEYRSLLNRVSQYEQQRPKLTRRNSNDRENIIKQQEQFDKANPEYVTLKEELNNIINRIERSDENGTYIYDHVSEQTEAWWDMEDRYPQKTLSDSIVSDLSSKEALRNTAEIAAENLGLLGRRDEIDALVEMQQQHIPLTETNYRNFRQQQEEGYERNIEANERELLLTYEREGFPEPINPNQEEIYDLPFFKTPEGEVYGFVDAEGNMYIDRRVAKPEHRIHEYTHLWDRMVISREPELWKRGVDLMQQFDNGSLWNEILNSEQYGKKWQENGITGEQLNNLIASEVHARLVGKNGEALLKEVARKRGQKGIINKLKQWMLDVWKSLKATFSDWKPEDIKELTLEDFNQMTLRDFADGLNFGKYTPMLTSEATESTETSLIENTANQLRDYYKWQREHVSFDKGSHTYYINGKSVDFSVTEYKDFVYGKPNIKGDYTHSTTIGDVVDELTRDFFTPNSKWEEKEYHNLNDSRKQEIVKHLRRFKEYLDKTYKDKEGKPNYKVITSEIPLVGEITVNGEKKTIAGTPDMIVIDGNGDVHLYDMKVKTNNIEDWNNRRDYTFQLNAYRQLIESVLPELAGKIKDLQLIWFNTKYPKQGKEATFVTSKTGIITVSDDVVKNMPLAEYEKWTTPSLKQDVKESIIPLDKRDVLSEVSPYDTNWKESLEPVEAPSNAELQGINNISAKTAAFGVETSNGSKDFWNKINSGWQTKNPNGIVAYRRNGNSPESFNNEAVSKNWIGNPFSVVDRGPITVQQFYDWLVNGYNPDPTKYEYATEENRQLMLKKILSTPSDSPILYYTELGRPSHATVIGYLIKNKHLIENAVTTQQQNFTTEQIFDKLKTNYPANSSEAKLTDFVYNAIKNTNIIFESADLGKGISGKFVASENKILYNPNALQSNTLLHEAIHAVTSYYLKTANRNQLPKEIQIAIKEIEECYELLKQDFIETHYYENGKLRKGISNIDAVFMYNIQSDDMYGYTSPTEMLAELGKPSFVEHIKDFDRRHKGKNIFQKLIDGIAKLFGINKSYGSLEATVKNALVTLLTHPDKTLMERYAKENRTIKENVSKLKEQSTIHITAVETWINEYIIDKIPQESGDVADIIISLTPEQTLGDHGVFQIKEGVKNPITKGKVGTIITAPGLYMMLNGEVTYSKNSENKDVINIPIRLFSTNYLQNHEFEIKEAENGTTYISEIKPLFPEISTQSIQQQVTGENISSKGSDFAKRLTNPFNNETVEFRGTKFDNAEHAYQTWKSGKFDQRGFDAHGRKVKGTTDYNSNYQTMVEIITAKLQQHPDLIQGITERGGMAYLNASTHNVVGDGYWETSGQNKFMEALKEAYQKVQETQKQVYETHKQLEKDLGGEEHADAEITDTVRVAKKGLSFEEALKGQESFFSKEEQDQIKQGLNGRNLQVMSVSRLTDPAFFSKEIISFLEKNAEKPLNDPTRVTAIEIWSKHDGLPIKDILDACKKYRVAPMVSFSITGLGGTALEGGVMKYQDMLEKVGELIKNGTLNPTTTTIRIDPILPGITNMDDIRKIVETAKSYGIKKFVTSLMQSYGYTVGTANDRKVISGIDNALASEGKTYDWDKYYGRDSKGKINFKPKQEVIDEIGKILIELDKDPEITIQTCSFGIKGLKVSACLDPMIIERITGVDVLRKDGTYDRDTSRPECMCYGCHGDFFKGKNKKCFSSCAYCYAAHSGDNKLNYYNEDGTLKDNDYTRTERLAQSPVQLNTVTNQVQANKAQQFVNHSGGAIGSDTYWGEIGEKYGVTSNHYYHGQKTPKGNVEITDTEFEEGKQHVLEANKTLNRKPDKYMDLLARNWIQAKNADSVFAIGHLTKGIVDGGTGWAVQMAIDTGKPVYVFDQERNQWYKNINGKWSESEVPTLTPNFAGIGTRNINEAGKKAIEEVYAKTFSNQQQESTDSLEQNVTPENETPMISLPNYASWMGQESFEVEQDWKAERLLELDGQLANTEIPFDVKEKIKKDIEKTLDAVNEEDLYTALSKRDAKKLQEKQGRLAELNRSIDRLQNSSILTPSDIHGAAKQIMDNISDMVTRIQDEPSIVKTWFPSLELQDDVDFTTMTRKEVVETIGIGRFLEAAKKSIDSSEVDYDDVKTEMQADLFVENWNALIQFGNSYFKINEGYGIQLNLTTGEHKTTEGQIIDSDDFNADSDPDRNFENIKDEQEHWQIEQKAIDIMNSPEADLIKTALHNCYETDENGQPVLSKWGKGKVHVDKRKAITSILNWVQGELTIKDMYKKLAEKQVKNPWLSGILDKLNPNDPESAYKNAKLQSLFFNTMCRSFQRYSFVQLQDGRYVAKPLNDHPAQTQVIKTIEALFNIGEHPLFQYTKDNKVVKGINIKLLGKAGDSKTDEFTLHSAFEELSDIKDRLEKGEAFSAEMSEQAKKNILGVCKILSFVPENSVLNAAISASNVKYMTDKLKFIVQNLDAAYKKEQENLNKPNVAPYEPFKFKGDLSIEGSVRNFFNPITNAMEEIMPNVVYDDGKLYQAYVTPSFLSLLMQKFHWDTDKFNDFIEKQYGYSEWFKTKDGYWRNDMLRRMATDEKARKAFSHTVELNLNNHRYMKNLSDIEYAVSLFAHYWGENARKGDTNPIAWFRMPMQSNKPSSEFFSFYSYRGANYKKNIVDGGLSREEMLSGAGGGLYGTFLQEMERIKTVLMRNDSMKDEKKKDPKENPNYIENFDEFGKYFNFLVFLNPYLASGKAEERTLLEETAEYKKKNGITKNENLAKLIQKRLEGEKVMSGEELLEMGNLAREAIRNALEKKAQKILDNWEETGILDAAKKVSYIANEIKDIKDEDAKNAAVRELLENFIWNDHFAAINILQLTIGDIAFYKNAEDLQKRLSQLHAPGIRPNVFAVVDNKGTRASDGKYRTLLIKDYKSFITNVIQNIEEVFDRRIANAKTAEEKKGWEMLKEDLVGSDGKYRKINVTDAQGYNSITSYRKKAMMFGRWSSEAEEIYQKLARGDKNIDKVRIAFQPLKPFVYTQLHKNIGISSKSEDGTSIESPIQHMPVPFQAKNSEYLLIMADALLKGEELSRPNLLRAVFRVMEDSAYDNREYDEYGRITKMGDYNGRGIDTIQFESAIKSGKQGVIDLNQFLEQPEGEESAYTFMMNQIYQRNDKGELTREYNTKTFIHETDFESYCLQQDVPGHFRNHYQAQGSQERMIIPSDLEYYKNPTLTAEEGLDSEDNINYYGKYKANEIRKEIENVTAANINLSIKEFKERLKWDSASEAEKNMALSEILQEEILDSTRYGIDMFLACGLDENGEFRIPLGDPIQAKRIEQLLNSIIKNSINKQEIAGGPIVQVSNYGVSRQLQIKFHDKNGDILLTKEEFEAKKNTKAYEKYKSYNDYKHENQAGIAYFEVFAPAWMRSLFKYFTDAYGNIDLETLEILNPDLLKMISYRIPTEDKYSIAPMKLVGFMPKEAGDALMLPYEITEIDDSDFDIDKRYVMRKVINIEPMFEVAKGEKFGKALDRYIKENKSNLIDNIIRDTNIKETLSEEEIQEITEGIGKSIELEKRTAERTHKENLAVIKTRYEQLDDANADTTWDKNAEKDDKIYEQNSARQDRSQQREIDRENKRYEAQLKKIEERRKEKEEREKAKALSRKIRQQVSDFLYLRSGKFYSPAGADDANTRAIRTAFLKQIFKLNDAPDQRTVNNNRIIDLTWDVLTNEKTASMILNPGGYDNFKKNCYMILNFQDLAKDIHDPEKLVELWNELKGKKIDDLKSAIKTNNDLTWVDTQLQFYRQNSAAASLLGRFAIEKIAHAILEGNGIFVNVKEICGIDSFSIAGFTFGGKRSKTGKPLLSAEDFSEDKKLSSEMTYEEYLLKNDYDPTLDNMTELDPTYSSNGFFVGKSLGSGVSASADAGKEDALSPVNINKNTINAFTSSLRFGMPHDISELFMAQKIIKEVLTEYVRSSIEDHKSLGEIIDNKLNAFEKEYGESSMLKNGKLSEAELLEGMLDREHKEVDYKVLYIFDKLKKLAEEVKKPTFITRFNSISNAVGPLIVDNLVMRHKMDDMDVSNINDIHFYKRAEDGTMAKVTMDTIFEDHPILKAFAETVGIAETLFRRMPAGSSGFKTLLDQMPSILSEKISQRIWNDKGLLNDLSNFYQSYLIIQAGLIKDTELKEFIEDFPKTFEKEYKKKYGNNAFVNAVMMSTSEKTSRTFLNIPQTGFDETVKDVYRSDMIELYKENPKLVWDLFKYAFFRGGINFSPKTWMNLVSTFIKERLETVNEDGKRVSYKDVYNYKTFPTVNPRTLLDQFVRNNWNDTKLVPRKKLEDTKYEIGSNNALLTVTDASEVAELSGIAYLKTVDEKKNAYLWRLLGKEEDNKEHRLYGRISPLGDNGEYLEMFRDTSTTKNDMDVLRRKPMTETTKESDKAASEGDLENSTLNEGETDGIAPRRELTDKEKVKNIEDFGEGILMQWQGTVNRNKTRADALAKANEIIGEVKNTGKLQKGMKAFISLALAKKGVVVSEDKVIEKLRELNLCD